LGIASTQVEQLMITTCDKVWRPSGLLMM